MKTPSITKQEILAKYRERFNDFPTSAMWYEPVLDFLSQSLDRVAQQTREETIEEIRSHIKPLADMEAALREMDKLTSQEKKEACRCEGHKKCLNHDEFCNCEKKEE